MDVYVKPEFCQNHGIHMEEHPENGLPVVHIQDPPSHVVYPPPDEETGAAAPLTQHRKLMKFGYCKWCWGKKPEPEDAPHEPKDCVFKDYCRACLLYIPDLPDGGYKHACQSGIISMEKTKAAPAAKSFQTPQAKETLVVSEAQKKRQERIRKRQQQVYQAAAAAEMTRDMEEEYSHGEDPSSANKARKTSPQVIHPPSPSLCSVCYCCVLMCVFRARPLVADGGKGRGQDVHSRLSRLWEELAWLFANLKDRINFLYPLLLNINSISILRLSLRTVKLDIDDFRKRLSKTGIFEFYVFLNGIT